MPPLSPQIRQMPPMLIVGLETHFQHAGSPLLPQLWQRLLARRSELPESAPLVGVIMPASGHQVLYLAGAAVPDGADVPQDMSRRTVPGGRYAVFLHRGDVAGMEKTMTAIFRDWFPGSGYVQRPAPQLELYDARFRPNSDDSEFEIAIPIE